MKASLGFILVTVFLDAVGLGLVYPILPKLLGEFLTPGPSATQAYGLFMALYALMQFLASPVLGSLSDRFGRRPILLFSVAGAGLDYLLMAFAPNLWLLFIGRIISGLTGASMTVASAYVSDTSDDANRASRFGQINAAFGVGFIVGPALGGYLGEYSAHAPFFAAAGMNLLNFLFGALILRESLAPEHRRKIELSRLNPFGSLKWAWVDRQIRRPIGVLMIQFFAGQIPGTMWAIYTAQRFGWDTWTIGLSFSAFGAAMAVAQGVLTQPLVKWLGSGRAVLILLAMEAATYVALGLVTQGWMVFALIVPLCIASIAGPTLQSEATAQVGPDKQGELQGTIISVMSLTAVITPVAATWAHSRFNTPDALASWNLPGAVFIIGGALSLMAAIAWWLTRRSPLTS